MQPNAPTSVAAPPDAGLVRRGLFLLGLLLTVAVVVVLIIVQRPSPPTKTAGADFALPLALPPAGYPAGIPWAALATLQDSLPSTPGWQVRYQATLALARRGSPRTPWPVFREMLDYERQLRNFPAKLHAGKIIPDDAMATHRVHNALGVLAEWHKLQNTSRMGMLPAGLQAIYEDVDRLAAGSHTMLKVQADRVRQTFFRE